jgi:membrane fusion protein, macrolide-specific efflux system
MNRGRLLLILGIFVVATFAVLVGRRAFQNRSLEVLKVTKGEIIEAVYGLGKVKSTHRFEVKLGVLATVQRLYVEEGGFVQKGDRLADFETGAHFRAPFAGTITLINNYEGETVVPQVPVLRLEDLKDRFIELSLEQEGALRIKPGQNARVSFETLRGTKLKGSVAALYSRDDEFLARIDVEGLDQSILPGMTADVAIEIGHVADALMIPVKAIQNGNVLIKRGGKQKKVRVEVGHVDGVMAEIKGGDIQLDDDILVKKAN